MAYLVFKHISDCVSLDTVHVTAMSLKERGKISTGGTGFWMVVFAFNMGAGNLALVLWRSNSFLTSDPFSKPVTLNS